MNIIRNQRRVTSRNSKQRENQYRDVIFNISLKIKRRRDRVKTVRKQDHKVEYVCQHIRQRDIFISSNDQHISNAYEHMCSDFYRIVSDVAWQWPQRWELFLVCHILPYRRATLFEKVAATKNA